MPLDVPIDAEGNPDRSKIDFYLIFMVEGEKSFSTYYEARIETKMLEYFGIILTIVLIGFSLVLFLIILLTM